MGLVGFVPECSEEELARINILDADWYIYEEGERKVATRQSRAQIMQPDVWTMSTGVDQARAVGLCRLSRPTWRHRRPLKRNHEEKP